MWTIYKLWKTNEHTILKLWTLIKNIIERTQKFPYNILFTFLMDRGRAPNGIGHLMILCKALRFDSTPEGRAASPMQDLTVWPPSCVISENSRSLVAIFFSDGNTRHCSRVYISRDLIWIKIVVGKTIYKQIVIILAIRFAVLSTVFQWK